MTHINSRDYVDTNRIKVSDNSENDTAPGDEIFAGIFSSVGKNTKNNSKNDDSLNKNMMKNDSVDDDVSTKNLGEVEKGSERQADAYQASKSLPYENDERSDISSHNVVNNINAKDEMEVDVLSFEKDKIDAHQVKDESISSTLMTPKKNWTQEGNFQQKLSSKSNHVTSSSNSSKFKNDETTIIKNTELKIRKSDDIQIIKDSADKGHENKKIISSPTSKNIKTDRDAKLNQHLVNSLEREVLPKEITEKSEDKIGQIDSEISGLIKRKKNNGKEESNHSSILKKSISRSLNKKKSILLEQELQKGIENSFAAKKKSLNQKNYIYDKPFQNVTYNLSNSSSSEQKNFLTMDSNQAQNFSSSQQGSQQSLNQIQHSNKVNEQLLQQLDLRDKNMPEGLLRRLERAISNGSTNFEIFLRPKNLGKLRIGISLDQNITTVRIVSETQTAALLLGESHAKLTQMMESAGLKLAEFSSGISQESSGEKNKDKKNHQKENDSKEIKHQKSVANSNTEKLLNNSDNTLLNVVA